MNTRRTLSAGLGVAVVIATLAATSALAQRPEGVEGRPEPSPIVRVIAAFIRCDQDKDGVLTEGDVPETAWLHLSAADADGDGSVTRKEAADTLATRLSDRFGTEEGAPDAVWERISSADADGDGNVTADELSKKIVERIAEIQAARGQGMPATDTLFARFDANGDGALTSKELPPPIWARLGNADTDGDGAITVDECEKVRSNSGQ